jgi:hypothetical protein
MNWITKRNFTNCFILIPHYGSLSCNTFYFFFNIFINFHSCFLCDHSNILRIVLVGTILYTTTYSYYIIYWRIFGLKQVAIPMYLKCNFLCVSIFFKDKKDKQMSYFWVTSCISMPNLLLCNTRQSALADIRARQKDRFYTIQPTHPYQIVITKLLGCYYEHKENTCHCFCLSCP